MDVQGINLLWPRFLSFIKNHIDDMIWTISYDTFWPKGGQKHDGHWSLFVWNVSLHSNHCIQAVSTNLKSLSKRFKIIIHGRFNNNRVPAYRILHDRYKCLYLTSGPDQDKNALFGSGQTSAMKNWKIWDQLGLSGPESSGTWTSNSAYKIGNVLENTNVK